MRDVLIFAILSCFLASAIVTNNLVRKIKNLELEITQLENEVAGKQLQIDDLHRLYPIQDRRVLKIQSDLSAREVIWMLQEVAENNDCIIVH